MAKMYPPKFNDDIEFQLSLAFDEITIIRIAEGYTEADKPTREYPYWSARIKWIDSHWTDYNWKLDSESSWLAIPMLPRLGFKTGRVDAHGVCVEPANTPRAKSRGLKEKGLVPTFNRNGYQRRLIPWPDDVDELADWMVRYCECFNDRQFLLIALQISMQEHPDVIKAWTSVMIMGDIELRHYAAQLAALECVGPRVRAIVGAATVAVGGLRTLDRAPQLKRALIRAAESGGAEARQVTQKAKAGTLGQRETIRLAAEADAAEAAAFQAFLVEYGPLAALPPGGFVQ